MSRIERAIIALSVVFFVVGVSHRFSAHTDSPKLEPAPVVVKKPSKVLDLGMTFEQFQASFRTNAVILNVPQLAIDAAKLSNGEFKHEYVLSFYINGTVDEATQRLKDVSILKFYVQNGYEKQLERKATAIAFLVLVRTLNPEMTSAERAELLEKFSGSFSRGSVVRGKVKYSFIEDGESLCFFAKAKDA